MKRYPSHGYTSETQSGQERERLQAFDCQQTSRGTTETPGIAI